MRIALCAALLLTFGPAAAPAAAGPAPAAQVMVLGVAHLQAKHDVHNSVFTDSPLSPKRQAQIAEIVERLARFHPTKVLIEASAQNPVYAQRYRDYLAGKFTLTENEIYQFGFRLAALSRNSSIYPVDTDGPAIIDDSSPSGKRINAFLVAAFPKLTTPSFDAMLARQETLERTGTYLDLLTFLNSDEAIRANASVYSVLDGMGRDTGNAGAAYVSQWYARNCYIFSNILSVVQPGDRAVVIMGQGHEYLLRELVRLNPGLTDVNPLTYLSREISKRT